MARIRTIKPEFFRHRRLFLAESETGLPLRVAFAGLWTRCDREGCFPWEPEDLKLDCLPYDNIDFSRVLDALTTRGFVVRYASGSREYGCVPGFARHQAINPKESKSTLPQPPREAIEKAEKLLTRQARVDDASPTRDARETILPVGKGREGKGKEGESSQPSRLDTASDAVAKAGCADDDLLTRAKKLRAKLETSLQLGTPITTAPILAWIQAGGTAALIETVVADVMANRPDGWKPNGISYFDKAVRQAIANGSAPLPASNGQGQPTTEKTFAEQDADRAASRARLDERRRKWAPAIAAGKHNDDIDQYDIRWMVREGLVTEQQAIDAGYRSATREWQTRSVYPPRCSP